MMERWDHEVNTKATTQLKPAQLFFNRLPFNLTKSQNISFVFFFSPQCTASPGCWGSGYAFPTDLNWPDTLFLEKRDSFADGMWEQDSRLGKQDKESWALPAAHLLINPERFLSSQVPLCEHGLCVYTFGESTSLHFCVEKEEDRVKFNF